MKAYLIHWGPMTIGPCLLTDHGLRFHEPDQSAGWSDRLIPTDATVEEVEIALVSAHGTCGGQCPRCGIGIVSGTEANCGKHTQWCDFCGRHTIGHNKVKERGPAREWVAKPITKTRNLRHIYGGSYFGSGGGYGRVKCLGNCREVGSLDNGFMSGPAGVEVIDYRQPAEFVATGGDAIGSNGRAWREAGKWNPQSRVWE